MRKEKPLWAAPKVFIGKYGLGWSFFPPVLLLYTAIEMSNGSIQYKRIWRSDEKKRKKLLSKR